MIFHYGDIPIYYEVHGRGPALVLVHGFLESSSMWKPFLPLLSDTFTLVTPDLPGHGKSGCIHEVHTMELMADVLDSLLKHLELSSVRLVGHSMGGYVSLAFAEDKGEQIESLMLLNSTTISDTPVRQRNRDRAIEALYENPELFLNLSISNLFSLENRQRYHEEIVQLKREALQFPLAGIKAALRGMKERKDRTDVFSSLKAHTYIVAGSEDSLLPVSKAKELSVKTKAHFYKVHGGHMSHIEAFNEIVKILHFIE